MNRFIGLINESVNTGRHVARTLGLSSNVALRNKLLADVDFHKDYVVNGAFRHGVDSMVLEGETKPAPAEARLRDARPKRTSSLRAHRYTKSPG